MVETPPISPTVLWQTHQELARIYANHKLHAPNEVYCRDDDRDTRIVTIHTMPMGKFLKGRGADTDFCVSLTQLFLQLYGVPQALAYTDPLRVDLKFDLRADVMSVAGGADMKEFFDGIDTTTSGIIRGQIHSDLNHFSFLHVDRNLREDFQIMYDPCFLMEMEPSPPAKPLLTSPSITPARHTESSLLYNKIREAVKYRNYWPLLLFCVDDQGTVIGWEDGQYLSSFAEL